MAREDHRKDSMSLRLMEFDHGCQSSPENSPLSGVVGPFGVNKRVRGDIERDSNAPVPGIAPVYLLCRFR
jgi:hypothetical protein